jgi:phytoene synthase
VSAQPQSLALLPPQDTSAVVLASREVLAKHAKTFRLASLLLSPQQRDEAAVVYAFCRLVDDAVDEAPDPDSARAALAPLKRELSALAPPRPLLRAFLEILGPHPAALAAAHELIVGVESDLGPVLLPDDEALLRYCYRVAGTVGLMMSPIIGVTSPDAPPHALDLGVGMQLTNICRDVAEDLTRGRVYLPETRLRAAGTSQAALLDGTAPREAVAAVIRDLLALADRHYQSGADGLRYIPLRPRAAIAAAGSMYRAIGLRLRAQGCDFTQGRAFVPAPTKLAWLARASLASLAATLGPPPHHDAALHAHLRGLPGAHTQERG